MANLPVPVGVAAPPSLQLPQDAAASAYARASTSMGTQRAYYSDWKDFDRWCGQKGYDALPANHEVVAAYLAQLADRGLKASTITRRSAAIGWVHRRAGHLPPTSHEAVRATQSGIRRTIGTAQVGKAPATAEVVKALLKALLREAPDTLAGKRDHALILVGFAAALRRSELVSLCVEDLRRAPEGVELLIRRSKTDQEGRGHTVAVPRGKKLKPVDALNTWLSAAGITSGPVFRPVGKGDRIGAEALTPASVALIIKRWAKAAKLDPKLFSGHSLRSGLITQALIDGADLFEIMDVSRHTEVKTLRKYDKRVKSFAQHAGRKSL